MEDSREGSDALATAVSSCSLDSASEVPRVAPQRLSRTELLKLEELDVSGVTPAEVDAVLAELELLCSREFPEVSVDRASAHRLSVANPGDVAAAVAQWRNAELWMREHKAAVEAHDTGKEGLVFRRGWDRLGHPVLIWNGLVHKSAERTPEEVTIATAAATQEISAALEEQGLEKCTIIVHLPRGTELDWRMGREVITFLQRNFPERLYRALIYPCGFWTQIAWSMLKIVVDPRTVQKLRFVSKQHPDEFLEFISPEQLPVCFGGTDDFELPTSVLVDEKGGDKPEKAN